jgi:hypothetical protein
MTQVPSRLMPKYVRRPVSTLGWISLAVLACAAAFLIWSHPLVVGGSMMLLALWGFLLTTFQRRRLRRLASGRSGETICSFVRGAPYREVDTWVLRAVYEQLQNYLSSDSALFPLRWDDDLSADLNIDDEDLEYDIASEIAQRTGRSCEANDTNPHYGKVRTVGDLVLFFNSQPKAGAA